MNVIHSVWIVILQGDILGVFHSKLAAEAAVQSKQYLSARIEYWEIT